MSTNSPTMARVDPTASHGEFKNLDSFYRWVSTNYGANVSRACKEQVTELLAKGQNADAIQILDRLIESTQFIDLSANGLRARFGY